MLPSLSGISRSSLARMWSVAPPDPTRGPGGSETHRNGTLGNSPASCLRWSCAVYHSSWAASPADITTRSQKGTPASC